MTATDKQWEKAKNKLQDICANLAEFKSEFPHIWQNINGQLEAECEEDYYSLETASQILTEAEEHCYMYSDRYNDVFKSMK